MRACVREISGRPAGAAMAIDNPNELHPGTLVPAYGIVLKPGHGTSHPRDSATPCGRSLGACTTGAREQLSLAVSGSNPSMAVAIRRLAAVSARPFAGRPNEERVREAGTRISPSDRFAAFRFDQQWTS